MKAKVAVATVSGKAYFLIVAELKERNVPFLSLIPGKPVPTEARVIITTKEEKHLINHQKVLVFNNELELGSLVGEATRILQGKEAYERVVIGIDPGKVFGLAVVADGNVIDTENCFSIEEAMDKVESVVKSIDPRSTVISIKIGNGFPECRGKLLNALDHALPPEAVLEVVSEAGTNRALGTHRRGLRDIVSAIRIAGRNGYIYPRGKADESDG
jgi:hypothetical protein